MFMSYDTVSWRFQEVVCNNSGLGDTFVWVNGALEQTKLMKCATSVTFQVWVNGRLTDPITPNRGLPQGDPYLHTCTLFAASPAHESRLGRVLHPELGPKGVRVGLLQFADDHFIFVGDNEKYFKKVDVILQTYEVEEGQKVNG